MNERRVFEKANFFCIKISPFLTYTLNIIAGQSWQKLNTTFYALELFCCFGKQSAESLISVFFANEGSSFLLFNLEVSNLQRDCKGKVL